MAASREGGLDTNENFSTRRLPAGPIAVNLVGLHGVFIALISIVVDAGADYVQRRQLFNSTDAAAQAGALQVATVGNTNGDVTERGEHVSRRPTAPTRPR